MSGRRLASGWTFLLLWLGVAPLQAAEHPALLYWSESGPVVIRLEVLIDGRPHDQAWRKFVDELFAELDNDADGVLSQTESRAIPDPAQFQMWGLVGRTRQSASDSPDADPRDGTVTKEELAAYLHRIFGDPLTVSMVGMNPSDRSRALVARDPSSNRETDLFETLDREADKELSPDDFALTAAMRKLDLDDDDTLSRAELQPFANPYIRFPGRREGITTEPSPFLNLSDSSQSPTELVGQLLQRCDSAPKDYRLSRQEFALGDEAFADRDADGNGFLDYDELRQFIRDPAPHVLVSVHVETRDRSFPPVAVTASNGFAGEIRSSDTKAIVVLGKVQLEFTGGGDERVIDLLSYYANQCKALDVDNNGYVDEQEAARDARIRNAFKALDADGDGKVFCDQEFVPYFNRLAKFAQVRTTLSIADQGNKLFDILDTNADGRLTAREIHRGREKVATWDEDQDGRLNKTEIPRNWLLSIARGVPNLGVLATFVDAASPDAVRQPPDSPAGPAWFPRMDRNNDGEITPREFLGLLADFDRLDANRDGVIAPNEAAAAR